MEFHACTSASIHTHPHPSLWTASLTGRRRGDRMRGREREKQMGCTAHATSRERGRGVSCCRGRVRGYYLFRLTLPTQSNPSPGPSSLLCLSLSDHPSSHACSAVHSMGKAARFLSVGKARCHRSRRRRRSGRPTGGIGARGGAWSLGRWVGPSSRRAGGCTL